MTVAAVILFCASAEGALADTAGRPAVRRMVETAWSGGATPVVVVAPMPDGAVAAARPVRPRSSPSRHRAAGPCRPDRARHSGGRGGVTETDAAIVWPGPMIWVDAETVTSLIEASGAQRDAVLRPRYEGEVGWPALIPVTHSMLRGTSGRACPTSCSADLAATGVEIVPIDTGDPGTANDLSTPLESLPEYEGPPEPVAGAAPEWGSAAAEMPDDAPSRARAGPLQPSHGRSRLTR